MSKKFTVFIGRFQPVHTAHVKIIEEALEQSDELIIVLGSYRAPRSLKNPWSYEERVSMIKKAVPGGLLDKVHFTYARDYLYDMTKWLTGVQNAVSRIAGDNPVKMIGHFKDDSSFYLKLFPQWEFTSQPNYFGANSTDIREALWREVRDESLEGLGIVQDVTPLEILDILEEFIQTKTAKNLAAEDLFLKKYRRKWADSPFPPTFVTTDAVVVQAGHVLLVKRGRNPGIGKYALPGGFISQNESILDSCLRELKEETGILFPKDELKHYVKKDHVFDHPYRDQRGRTITHAYYFHIDKLGPLPKVEGADDADEAMWVPLAELALLEEDFFSDHIHIINYFIHN